MDVSQRDSGQLHGMEWMDGWMDGGGLQFLSGGLTVREVALGGDLHGAQDGQIDPAAPDHAEALVAAEAARAGQQGDGLFARVDQIRIFLAFVRIRAKS